NHLRLLDGALGSHLSGEERFDIAGIKCRINRVTTISRRQLLARTYGWLARQLATGFNTCHFTGDHCAYTRAPVLAPHYVSRFGRLAPNSNRAVGSGSLFNRMG